MYQPIISNNAKQKEIFLNSFAGLNRKEYAKDNEFADMKNLSSDKYPYISVRKSRDKYSNLKHSNGEITDNDVYATYCNPYDDKCVVRFNGKTLVLPNEDLGDGIKATDFGKLENGAPENVGAFTDVSGSTFKNRLVLGTTELSSIGTWDKYFRVGDRISISGSVNYTYQINNNKEPYDETIDTIDDEIITEDVSVYKMVSCVVEEIDGKTMYVGCYNKNGDPVQLIYSYNSHFINVTIKHLIPKITNACVSNNRIFGVTESGKYIYACKQGDYKRWYTYEGISTDSWYGQVGTEGGFTGIVEFNGSVIAFKRDYIYKIYGDNPKNFTIQKQSSDGCIDKKSIVELNGRLYFLSQNGFCVYSGGYPAIISEVLNRRYMNATGGTDGRKIYFYAMTISGEKELLVYDTMLNMWHKEDTANAISCFFRYNGELYFVQETDNEIYKINGYGYSSGWYFKTPQYNTMGMNYTKLSEVIIYASTGSTSNCSMNVYVLYDGASDGQRTACGSFTLKPNITQRIPIKIKPCFSYSLAVQGIGAVIIKGIEHIYTAGGKNDGNRR